MLIENEKGEEITVFTAEEKAAAEAAIKAEYEAKLVDKDNHLKSKLDEFSKGKTASELKDAERDAAVAEAKKIAEEAKASVTNSEEKRQNTLKEVAMKKYVGNNPELKAKFDESWSLINLEIKDDSDVTRKAELVANMLGYNNQSNLGSMSMGGGYAPAVSSVEKEKSDADHQKFMDALPGMDSFIPKSKDNK